MLTPPQNHLLHNLVPHHKHLHQQRQHTHNHNLIAIRRPHHDNSNGALQRRLRRQQRHAAHIRDVNLVSRLHKDGIDATRHSRLDGIDAVSRSHNGDINTTRRPHLDIDTIRHSYLDIDATRHPHNGGRGAEFENCKHGRGADFGGCHG